MNSQLDYYLSSINKIKKSDLDSPRSWFTADELASFYKIPKPTFTNKVNVAVISFGGGVFGNITGSGILSYSDCYNYWKSINISETNMPKIIIRELLGVKNTPNEDDGATVNNTVTIQQIGACCPSSNLNIILYIVPNNIDNLPNVLNIILNDKYTPSVIAIPWGTSENILSDDLIQNINNIFETAKSKGINIVAGCNNRIDFPASSPNVIACGGSKIVFDTKKEETKIISFSSNVFSKPDYQYNLNNTNRIIPDIVLNSETNVMYLINKKQYLIKGPTISISILSGFILASGINKFINDIIYWSSNCFNKLSTSLGSIIGDKLSVYINNFVPVLSISFDKENLSLQLNKNKKISLQKCQLKVNVLPLNATNNNITWSSSNSKVASVNSSGLLTFSNKGTVIITASLLERGLNTKCNINII